MNRLIVGEADFIRARPAEARSFAYAPDMAPGLVMAFEALVIALIGAVIWSLPEFRRPEYLNQHAFAVIFIIFAYCQLGRWASFFELTTLMRPVRFADSILTSIVTAFLFLLAILTGLDATYVFDTNALIGFFAATVVGISLTRITCFAALAALSRRGVIGRNLVVLGTGPQGQRFLQRVGRDPPYFTKVLGVFSNEPNERQSTCHGFPVRGDITDLLAEARAGHVDDVVVALPWSADRKVIETIEALKELPVNVYLGVDLVGFDLAFHPVVGSFSQLTMFEVLQRPISGWSGVAKTVMDYALALCALVLLAPFFLIVAIAIKLDSEGPVFFMQKRLGFNNKPFSIYKFRSMHIHDETDGVVRQATKGDPRVTRIGRIIRATSIDELPQLLNVLDGSMSLVGPRPHAICHNEEYGRQIRGYFARHKVRPGITGWAQVNGLRGETSDVELMRRRVEHDVYYTENWSLLFDLKIIVMTLLVVLRHRSAY